MISLAAIEANVQRLWPQARHAVVSLTSERQREQIVLLTEQPDATLAALRAWCAPRAVRPSETPRRILVIEEIPFLPTGKVDYAAAQSIAEEMLKSREGDAEEPA
jgi:acyl-[acyl-carrier-protein]-phospholipid O-acyltransferase/long-chain-fatty-acid--[acyl-carrier-protein] ligase